MKPTWILIANASQARLLQQGKGRVLTELQSMVHPASRLHSSVLGDDKAGRDMGGSSFGGAAYEPRLDAQRKVQQQFARDIAQLLEQGALAHHYAALALFASSPFLGELKHALGPAARCLLGSTHDLDLTAVTLADLPARLSQVLPYGHQAR